MTWLFSLASRLRGAGLAFAVFFLGVVSFVSLPLVRQATRAHANQPAFHWPAGKRAAASLTFDDARTSQVTLGLPLLQRRKVRATFYVQSNKVRKHLDAWKAAVAAGHEIGNHTRTHPCSANYGLAQGKPLEDFNLESMAEQLDGANAEIENLLGVKPRAFAYPCGQKFVGRGVDVRSYVPLVAERFLSGRGYMDDSSNDPVVCDLSQVMGLPSDNLDFAQLKNLVDLAAAQGRWIIFVGHDIGKRDRQATDTAALDALCAYLNDPANGIWVETVSEVADYIHQQRSAVALEHSGMPVAQLF